MATRIIELPGKPRALALLLIRNGRQAGRPLSLNVGVTKIGRSGQANDHPIDDDAVSDQHLSIRLRDGAYVLTDLDSTNGTSVNGERVAQHPLQDKDVIKIGETELVFLRFDDVVASDGNAAIGQ